MALYLVVSPQKVYIDYGDGRVLGFGTGDVFDADPNLPSVGVLLRSNPTVIVPFTPSEAFTALPAGVPGGCATLDLGGTIPVTQLPGANAMDSEVAAAVVVHAAIATAHHSNANDPSTTEKAALAGTSGTPSGTNKYVTDADSRNTDSRTPTAHAASHTDGTDDIDMQAAGAPAWVKVSKLATDFTAAGLTEDIEVYSLPAGGVIHAVKIKHSTAFSGGTCSAYTLSVGIAGTLAKYAAAFDVFQATGNTVFQLTSTVGSENHGAATSIRLAATSTGDNLVNVTAGAVDVWLLVSVAV